MLVIVRRETLFESCCIVTDSLFNSMSSFNQVKVGGGSPLLSLQVIENVVFIVTMISVFLRQLQFEERVTEGRARERETDRQRQRKRERREKREISVDSIQLIN